MGIQKTPGSFLTAHPSCRYSLRLNSRAPWITQDEDFMLVNFIEESVLPDEEFSDIGLLDFWHHPSAMSQGLQTSAASRIS
jgi:hypothetical protein